ncbi:uncharacterized protein BDZ99DRAFT_474974 [Mytilinidion resinicola]|uniref:NACHT-NTPase and P-loop NTPases N-terminal domain-containing protein n=1 Tax=Mytilinidion resinicola TaxID=574789 RepID=A0A6A6YS79_9PEZI|nr:uncharacterized protein BDZ99DRAFT_474974 [Mytilinidion resinicola]KAF2811408.1 hypothetical protein BDZ99DRAFT_474974 [Mytilinidion resinicola]
MELAAIGLASNVIQFVEVGFKIVAISKTIHDSTSRAPRRNDELNALVTNLSVQTKEAMANCSILRGSGAALELVEQCKQLNEEIRPVLDKLKFTRKGKSSSSG